MHRAQRNPQSAFLRVVTLVTLVPSAVRAQEHAHAGAPADGEASNVSLYDDLGDHRRPITVASPEAQAYFDQGLRLHWAFNHPEAIRSWKEALRHDPECAMCWWAIALASGPNINGAMDEASARRAYDAIGRARALAEGTTPVERALIEALSTRYAADPKAARPALDSAYARAMADVARNYPDDADVLALYADAVMNLSPWNYWVGPFGDRTPRPQTLELVAVLEHALALAPENPGACHLYIHLMEAARPEKAVACADRLAALMPGAGHIVHMPAHIYIRVGRWADAVRANQHAVHSDEAWMADVGVSSMYTMGYYPHNYHFLAFAATMAGMSEVALEAARTVAPKVEIEIAKQVPWIQNAVVLPQLTLVTFGRWEDVLDEPAPPAVLTHATVMDLYARGVALAALGRADEANAFLARVEEVRAGAGDPAANPIPHIAAHALAGEIALRSGRPEDAVTAFEAAVALEDGLLYEEPPLWYYPLRHSLGRALLEAGRPAEAEAAYRTGLKRFPGNGWSLFGLAEALEAQGDSAEAADVRARFRAAWSEADVTLGTSRF